MMVFTVCPSLTLYVLSFLAHGSALVAVLSNDIYGPAFGSLVAVLVVLSWIRFLFSRRTLLLRVVGNRWVVDGDHTQLLRAPLFTGRWFIVLRFSLAGCLVIGWDSLPANEFRRLKVLLRARANRMMAA